MHRLLPIALLLLGSPMLQGAGHEMVHGMSLEAPPRPITAEAIAEVHSEAGAQWVAIIPYGMGRQGEPAIRFNVERQWWGEREDGVRAQIRMAHDAGLRVMLKPQLWIRGQFTGHMTYSSEEDWSAWEADYKAFIRHFLTIAESEGVEAFCIGTELCESVRRRPAYWEELIAICREEFSGKLTYAANWDSCAQPRFWKQLDAVGVNAYFPIRSSNLERAWAGYRSKLASLSHRTGKPIVFTEYGYRSVEDTLRKPWEEANGRAISTEDQRQALEALYENFWEDPPDWFAGGFLWKWKLREDAGGPADHGYTVQGKPALTLVRQAYSPKIAPSS